MKFTQIEPPTEMLRDQIAFGAEDLALYRAETYKPGQFVRVMIAREPAPELLWHISMSIGPYYGESSDSPTDGQCKAVLRELKPNIVFGEMLTAHPSVRHFWEQP